MRGTGGGWRLLAPLTVVNVVLFAAYNGVLAVLLPTQIEDHDPAGKVASLAAVTSLSFAVTAVAQPVLGALSDRTRSRLGRRVPWMLGGAVFGGAALGSMGALNSVAALALLWAVAQFALNAIDVVSSAYVVEAFPVRRRGLAGGVLGVAVVLGGALGAAVAGLFVAAPGAGYALLAAAVLVVVVAFAFAVRDAPALQARAPFRPREFLRGFLIDPRRHPDFAWMFVWRLCFTVASGGVQGYLLYLLTDYIGVGAGTAASVVAASTIVGGVFAVAAMAVGGWLSDRVGRRKPFLVVACLVVAAADVVPLLSPTVLGILVLAAASGLGLGLSIACGTALVSEVLPGPERHAARGMGLHNVATNVGQALAPLLATAVIGAVGGYGPLFVAGGILMLVAAATVLPIRSAR